MFIKKYNSIMEKGEDHRYKWALGLSIVCSLIIFSSFGFYKGYITIEKQDSQNQVANVFSAQEAPSPIENSKDIFGKFFKDVNEEYKSFKESVSSVFVPFVTSIEVYDRVEK